MNNRERLIIYPLLAILALATLTDLRPTQAQREPGEATFRKLTIVDETGRPRIKLAVVEGGPYVSLWDEDGKPRVSLGLVEGEHGLAVFDRDGKVRVGLGLVEGKPSLSLWDRDGKGSVALGLAGLALYDRNGKLIGRAP